MNDPEQLDPSQLTNDEYTSTVVALKQVPAELASVHGAGFWHRALARAIDSIFHILCSFLAGIAVVLFAAVYAGFTRTDFTHYVDKMGKDHSTFLVYLFSAAGALMFHAISEGLNGSSAGKRICGLVVLSESRSLCSFKAALGRSAAFFIDGLFFGVVGAVNMSDSQLHQRLGDKWNRTIVCRRKEVQPSVLQSGHAFFKVTVLAVAVDVTLQSLGFVFKMIL